MTHVVLLTEGYIEHLDKFEKDFHGKLYPISQQRLRVREVRLYDLAIPKEGLPELKEDLLSLQGRIWGDRKDGTFQWNLLIKVVRALLRPIGLVPMDLTGVKNSGWRGAEADGKHNYNAHFIVLGSVPDPMSKDGEELV